MAIVAGIDGCRGGWLYLSKDLDSPDISARVLSDIGALASLEIPPDLVMIDMPIGLTEAGPRECDLRARRALKAPRASSVFPAPIRPVLEAMSYLEACEIGVRSDGRRLSQQAWAIVPKIREVDRFLRSDPRRNDWLREVHPEVCFWAWGGGRPMAHKKKSVAGRKEREELVIPYFGEAYDLCRKMLPRGTYAADDLLDAFAALWTAERVMRGTAMSLPERPPRDEVGLRMEMLA